MEQRLIDIKSASQYLGFTEGALYNMVWRREIPFVKIGRRVKFDRHKLDEWVNEKTVNEAEVFIAQKFKV